jgi:hypothetical protein
MTTACWAGEAGRVAPLSRACPAQAKPGCRCETGRVCCRACLQEQHACVGCLYVYLILALEATQLFKVFVQLSRSKGATTLTALSNVQSQSMMVYKAHILTCQCANSCLCPFLPSRIRPLTFSCPPQAPHSSLSTENSVSEYIHACQLALLCFCRCRSHVLVIFDPVQSALSSTIVRSELRNRRSIRYLVSEPVRRYLEEEHVNLYG